MKKYRSLKAKLKINFIFYARKASGYLALFSTILFFGWIFNRTIETVFMMIGYLTTRFCVPKIYHFNTTQKCITVSTMTFLFGLAILCVPNNISIVWNIIVGAIIPLIMYAESLIFVPKSKNEEIIELCKKYHYTELKTNLAIKFFSENMATKEVWLWLCKNYPNSIEYDSLKQARWRMKKQLFK